MEYYNNILCITGRELILSEANPNGLVPKGTYDSWVARKRVLVLRQGKGEGNYSLISLDSLPEKYRMLAKVRFGEPEVMAQRTGLMKYLEIDREAVTWFANYRVGYDDNEKSLPDEVQELYCRNAAVLNALGKYWEAHSIGMRGRNFRPLAGTFWANAAKALPKLPKKWACALPKSSKRLRDKYDDYKRNGYGVILSGKWGNKNTQKITPEVCDWLVAQWSSYINIVTIEQLHARYNHVADSKGWKKIKSSAAIRDYLFRPEVEESWYAARYGELAYKEKYGRQHRTKLPTYRDSLWYSDGTKLNYYYQDENGKIATCNVYEVIDTYSEAFLGYYISKAEDFEAQYMAFKMAVKTAGYKPFEVKFDNQGGHKLMDTGGFFQNLTRHAIKTTPYNGKSKTIESAFGRFQSSFLHKDWFFTGQNITTVKLESKARTEFVLANTKKLPTLAEVKEIYRMRRDEWNNAPHPKTGIPRMEMYRTSATNGTPEVDFLDMITMFGLMTKEPSTYRASGIEIEVKKKKYAFEVLGADGMPDADFNRRNIGRRFYVRYDIEDMSVISLYEKDASDRFRFVNFAQTYIKVQRNMQEQTSSDLSFIRQMQERNRQQRLDNAKQLNERLERYDLHPNQHGLNAPKPKGISTSTKRKVDIGEIQKKVSEMAMLEEQKAVVKKETRKAERKVAKVAEEDRSDFYKNRAELLKAALN